MAEASQEKQEETPTVNETQPVKKSLCADAFQNFLQGKRHLLVKDYAHAVQSLALSCELHTDHYGEMAPECGEVYFHYGKALFRLFQEQAGIFGDTQPDGSEDEEENESAGSGEEKENDGGADDEDKANDENEDGSNDAKEEENNDAKEDDSESVTSSKEDEKMDLVEESVKPSTDTAENNSNVNDIPSLTVSNSSIPNSTSEKKTEGSANDLAKAGPSTSNAKASSSTEDEVSDLQLAWETLEIAKKIFQMQGENHKDAQLKVADILLILGEIGLECDNCEDAIKDLNDCLTIWQRHLTSDDRRIAMTHYQLGLAHQLKGESKRSMEYFQNTMDVMQLRINVLSKQTVIEQNEDGFDIDPKLEITELEALVLNVKMRMEDAKEIDKDTKKAIEELAFKKKVESGDIKEVTEISEEKKPALNISHLLKRKKPDDQESTSKEEVKKIKLSSPAKSTDEQRQSTSEEVSPPRA